MLVLVAAILQVSKYCRFLGTMRRRPLRSTLMAFTSRLMTEDGDPPNPQFIAMAECRCEPGFITLLH